jgi:uncharacterized protein with NAD-binding domain and iron-sulfur cluster
VLGGGAGALAAAFALSDPALDPGFEVTVYTRGWRLGGKGASGRNGDRHRRIEEHGLHLWFGFYEEAIGLMQDAYREAEMGAWTDAFSAVRHLELWYDPERAGARRRWVLSLPAEGPATWRREIGPVDYGRAIGDWLRTILRAAPAGYVEGSVRSSLDRLAEEPPPRGVHPVRRAVAVLEQVAGGLARRRPDRVHPDLIELVDFFAAVVRAMARHEVVRVEGRRWVWDRAALTAADEHDFRTWIGWPGTRTAPFLRALYDLVFAYEGGRRDRPAFAAGTGVRGLMRIVGEHRGSFMLRMEGAVGDVVFTPLYRALSRRGVTFRFFHAVRGLRTDGDRVAAIDVVEQAAVAGGAYHPLDAYGTWPAAPQAHQLDGAADGDFEHVLNPLGRRGHRLAVGEHFDDVVLGIPPWALGDGGATLAAGDPPFARMLRVVPTVATQAAQLWLTTTPQEVGVADGGGRVTGAYAAPFDTYVDLGHLRAHEDWPDESKIEHIAYLCGVLDEREPDVRANLRRFLEHHPSGAGLREGLADRQGRPGGTADDQYVRANVQGSDRYVQSLPGTVAARLPVDGSRYVNLALAGDWTRSSVDAGCMEAAVSSGLAAARALSRAS